mmetsp:Transcript_64698/g.142764  ORF Transcript_64698/g.142764 Transcript_64698/m.142764 type:complete len:203 (-) Transcript_64698:173-781(-)
MGRLLPTKTLLHVTTVECLRPMPACTGPAPRCVCQPTKCFHFPDVDSRHPRTSHQPLALTSTRMASPWRASTTESAEAESRGGFWPSAAVLQTVSSLGKKCTVIPQASGVCCAGGGASPLLTGGARAKATVRPPVSLSPRCPSCSVRPTCSSRQPAAQLPPALQAGSGSRNHTVPHRYMSGRLAPVRPSSSFTTTSFMVLVK